MNETNPIVTPKRSLLDCWNMIMPNSAPRRSQVETFEWIESLSPDVKYMLLEMPVGGGKSPVGLTISAWLSQGYGSSFILTPQKILQKQYEDSFSKQILSSMYGKSNYTCKSKSTSCEVGSTIKPKCDFCPQKAAFQAAMKSNNLVLNYTLGLLYFAHVDGIMPRNLMIMDECHNLESQLINFSTLTISEWTCDQMKSIKYVKPHNLQDAHIWVRDEYFPRLNQYITRLNDEVMRIESYAENSVGKSISKEDQNTIKRYHTYVRHATTVRDIMLESLEYLLDNYVIIVEDKKFTIKALYGSTAFHNIVKPMADKFLLMSSTILNRDGFCRDLGIDPEQAAFLSLQSEFDRGNRLVIYQPTAKMNYGWDNNEPSRNAARTRMILNIKDILDAHKDVSGIIHTGSFKLSNWVVRELATNKTHYVLHHNPTGDKFNDANRDDVITEYMNSAKVRPTLLVSPSITEGLDLKHDLGRFAIFAKVPYPNIGDAWIKRRMEISADWYRRQTLKEMIQGSGRICRTPTDWGVTYILDESFTYLYNATKTHVIPRWWKDGLEIM